VAVLLFLLGWIAFAHGCHADEDDEPGLFPHLRPRKHVAPGVPGECRVCVSRWLRPGFAP
jgi:hypothetical protein